MADLLNTDKGLMPDFAAKGKRGMSHSATSFGIRNFNGLRDVVNQIFIFASNQPRCLVAAISNLVAAITKTHRFQTLPIGFLHNRLWQMRRVEFGVAEVQVKSDYKRSVDLARFVAAFGIVWDHARAPYADIGYTALALFLVLTSFLAVGSFERSDGRGFWISRAQRIMLPWLVWCAFYRVVFEYMSNEPARLLSDPWTLLIGPSVHLWFLPFVMIFLVTIPWVSRFIDRPMRLYLAAVLLAMIAIPLGLMHAKLAPAAWFITEAQFPQPLPQWFYSLPLFWFGAILAAGKRMGLVWPVIAAAAIVSVVLYARVPEFASVQMILVAVLFEAIWRVNITGKWPTWLAGFAFGIYLLHPFAMLVAFKIFGAEIDRSFAALFGFALAWAITAGLQRIPGINRFA